MWAQLIQMQLKPGEDTAELIELIRSAEQPDSGLIRATFMRDQADPTRFFTFAVFESEEKARDRERDPRRAEKLATAGAIMAEIFEEPREFTDLQVVNEWTGARA